MCGLAGVVRRGAPIEDHDTLALTLSAALAHRGPDGHASWASADHDALLVHTRLAIIDPRPEAAQPMRSASGHHVIVFNGEIFNYRELRKTLESSGARFQTTSDTEVLMALLATYGPDALARVRGMFALACWNVRERTLILARDRFGIKPLYVARSRDQLAFASELGALARSGLIDGGPSALGLLAYLSWGSVPPPLAWRHGAEVLPPGAWLMWRADGRDSRGEFADSRETYRSIHRKPRPSREFAAQAVDAVRDSVRAHLVADVPVGVFLSSGIDSSAILSAAAAAGAADIQTFTVGFDHESSESGRAREIAGRLGAKHHELQIDPRGIASALPRMLAHLDQPTIDGVNTYSISGAVAATGIKAVLSGTGGDELFGGYPSFRRLPPAMTLKRLTAPVWPVLGRMVEPMIAPRLRARWSHFASTNGNLTEAYRVQRGLWLPTEIDAIAGDALRDAPELRSPALDLRDVERGLLEPSGDESPLASISRLETRLYLGAQLLRDTDVMSMAHGLEVRVPLVDHQLADVVWPELGFHPQLLENKRLLSAAVSPLVRPLVVGRPKQGFTLPFARWIGGELAPIVREGMQQLAARAWLARGVPDRIWTDWQGGRLHWTRPWSLGILGQMIASVA